MHSVPAGLPDTVPAVPVVGPRLWPRPLAPLLQLRSAGLGVAAQVRASPSAKSSRHGCSSKVSFHHGPGQQLPSCIMGTGCACR